MVRNVSRSSRASRREFVTASSGPSPSSSTLASVHPGVLADVERVQMEAERADFSQQGTEVSVGEPLAAVRLRDSFWISTKSCFKFSGIAVSAGSVDGLASCIAVCETCKTESGDNFRSDCAAPRRGARPRTCVRSVADRARSSLEIPVCRREELRRSLSDSTSSEIFAKNQPASHFQRIADAMGLDEGIAVAISANPGTEMNDVRIQ